VEHVSRLTTETQSRVLFKSCLHPTNFKFTFCIGISCVSTLAQIESSITMTTESSYRDDWLAQIEKSVEAKAGDQWRKGRWSEYVKDVVWWLHNEKERDDEDTVDAAVGLIKYGIKKKEDLVGVAGTLPDADRFNNRLEPKGVLPAICDILFNKYVAPPPPQQQQHGKLLFVARS